MRSDNRTNVGYIVREYAWLALALTGPLTPIEWAEPDESIAAPAKVDEVSDDAVITH